MKRIQVRMRVLSYSEGEAVQSPAKIWGSMIGSDL